MLDQKVWCSIYCRCAKKARLLNVFELFCLLLPNNRLDNSTKGNGLEYGLNLCNEQREKSFYPYSLFNIG